MKAAFIYTAIGILVVVVLLQIYYMNESYQDASGNVMDASGNMVTLSLSDLFKAMRFNGADGGVVSGSAANASAVTSAPPSAAPASAAPAPAAAPTSGTWTGSGTWAGPNGPSGATSATGNMSQLIVDRSTTQPPLPIPGACDAGSGAGSCPSNDGCSSGGGCSGYDNMASGGAPFNMNDYIRKDSIPCYGCTLPQ